MLIKIAKAPYNQHSSKNSYIIYDKVDSVESFCTEPFGLENNDELRQNFRMIGMHCDPAPDIYVTEIDKDTIASFIGYGDASCSNIPERHLTEGQIYKYNTIKFTRNSKVYYATFDTIAYICNDEGQTLEKCFAGGLQSK